MPSPQTTVSSRLINRSPIHYSWVILAAGTLGMIMSSPGQTYAFSVFIEHFIADLGISRSLVSTLYTIGTLAASFGLPWVGKMIDQRGTRVMVALIAGGLGLGCLYMSVVRTAVMLGLGIVLMRFLGQGSMTLVSQTAINHWWVRRRGMALGVAGLVGSLLGTGTFPSLINWLIGMLGWRSSYRVLGLMVVVIMLPVGWALYRRPPEVYGLEPDGGVVRGAKSSAQGKVPLDEQNFTRAQALRTPAFWIASAGLSAMSMLTTGLHFHMVGIAQDAGLTAAAAATIYVPMAVTTSLVVLGSGILVDRISARFLLACALLMQAGALLMAQTLSSIALAFAYGVVLGTTSGLESTVRGVIWPNYFGRRHLGSIAGITGLIMVASSAMGPLPLGIARDTLGSYGATLTILAILPLSLAVVSLFMSRPTLPAQGAEG